MEDGKWDFLTESWKRKRKSSVNISAFSLIVFIGISVPWHALEVSNFKIFLRISSIFIFEKENDSLGCLLHNSPIVCMQVWFLYLTTHFTTGSLILLAKVLQLEYFAILKLLIIILEKKVDFQSFVIIERFLIRISGIVRFPQKWDTITALFWILFFLFLQLCFKVHFLPSFP